jgi:hypothetical protein
VVVLEQQALQEVQGVQRDGAFVAYSSFNIPYLGRSKGVVVQGKMTISCCFAAFSGGGTAEKSEFG